MLQKEKNSTKRHDVRKLRTGPGIQGYKIIGGSGLHTGDLSRFPRGLSQGEGGHGGVSEIR